ncbi:hypothetical protein [Anaeromicrobium sediminis]|nr:hypothetical protein [Anaeromicrobium sediminis]
MANLQDQYDRYIDRLADLDSLGINEYVMSYEEYCNEFEDFNREH